MVCRECILCEYKQKNRSNSFAFFDAFYVMYLDLLRFWMNGRFGSDLLSYPMIRTNGTIFSPIYSMLNSMYSFP